jgi:hypothetical protein
MESWKAPLFILVLAGWHRKKKKKLNALIAHSKEGFTNTMKCPRKNT